MPYEFDVSIIIINWKSADLLRHCLKSIYANRKDSAFEVVVIDNASFDGSEEMVRQEFPEVKFIQSSENLGFAKANNLGFQSANSETILFLNPDTEIIGTAIQIMTASLSSLPSAGAVGCKLLNTDGSIQMSCVQRFPSILNQVLDTEYLRKCFPGLGMWGIRPLVEPVGRTTEVDVISGACLMVRRDVFKQVEQFTTNYFMYSEDVDLCYKVKKAGRKNYYVPDAEVIHHGGKSSDLKQENHFASVMMRESRLNFFKARQGHSYAFLYQLSTAGAAICRVFILSTILLITAGMYRRADLCAALAKWTRIFRWAVGREVWAKGMG